MNDRESFYKNFQGEPTLLSDSFERESLDYKRLISYYDFRLKLGKWLSTGIMDSSKEQDPELKKQIERKGYISNYLTLIDAKILKAWKDYVKYEEKKNILSQHYLTAETFKNQADFSFGEYKTFIEENNNIDYNIAFECVDKITFKLFYGLDTFKMFQFKVFKEKLIIYLKTHLILVKFKYQEKYYEIIIQIDENSNNNNNRDIIEYLENNDVINFLKEINFDIKNDDSKTITFKNNQFKVINKSLITFIKIGGVKNCFNIPDKKNLVHNNKISPNTKVLISNNYINTKIKYKNQNNENNFFPNNKQNDNLNKFNNNNGFGQNNINIIQNDNINIQNNQNNNIFNYNYQNNSYQQPNLGNFILNPSKEQSNQIIQNLNNQNNLINNNQIKPVNQVNNQVYNQVYNQDNNQVLNQVNNQVKKQDDSQIELPHMKGLQNVGQACYMNSSLQCLINIKRLSERLLKKYLNIQNLDYEIDNYPLSTVMGSLIYELINTQNKFIVPELFKTIIGELNPLFKGYQAADSKDLIFFIIEKLHKELKKNQKNDEDEDIFIDYQKEENDSYNEQTMLVKFYKDFELRNQSCVSDIFYGIRRTTLTCNKCQKTKFSFQTFNITIFYLKKIYEKKKEELGAYIIGQKFSLYDAFLNEVKEEELKGDNKIYCNYCKSLQDAKHKQDFFGMPEVMIIVLNRGKNNKDFNDEFEFPLTLDFSTINMILHEKSYKKFYLGGVLTHLGESGSSGHFIAYCRSDPNSNKFICYNDAFVTEVDAEKALKTNISQNENERRTPYILFYHVIKEEQKMG